MTPNEPPWLCDINQAFISNEKMQMSLEASDSPQILRMPFKQRLIGIELSAGQKGR